MQCLRLARVAEAARLEDFLPAGVQEDEDRRVVRRRELAQLFVGQVVRRRFRLENGEVLRVEVLQLSAGERAGDVPAQASAGAGIENQHVPRSILPGVGLRLLQRIHGVGQAIAVGEAAQRKKQGCNCESFHGVLHV